MIVKNESLVIQRCLDLVKPWIDYWVIVDTGSNDGTQKIIKEALKDIPGELHERPWKSFAHNRNEALQLAKDKARYLMLIDADERFQYPKSAAWPHLVYDCYLVNVKTKVQQSPRPLLIKTDLPWKWKGVLHEELNCESGKASASIIEGIAIYADTEDGYRSQDPKKYAKDAEILEEALLKEPDNPRYTIFLAESYYISGNYEAALKAYQKRVALGGWDQEIYYALYRAACCKELLNKSAVEVAEGYIKAYQYRPTRGEPLFRLAKYYLKLGRLALAKQAAQELVSMKAPSGEIQIESAIYENLRFDLLDECTALLENSPKSGIVSR